MIRRIEKRIAVAILLKGPSIKALLCAWTIIAFFSLTNLVMLNGAAQCILQLMQR